ncbi:MAG: hypothetical protein COT74_05695 [Bdellovibrionales bacterium CG10_big_fil_rev_8_21_14_0_10_45_34]|nr:MAG: hypothetical protein COT74_05695 [Bdellovibrionales bacterium CG10_big_fil_rev_8_21_14_0_10_45_34]
MENFSTNYFGTSGLRRFTKLQICLYICIVFGGSIEGESSPRVKNILRAKSLEEYRQLEASDFGKPAVNSKVCEKSYVQLMTRGQAMNLLKRSNRLTKSCTEDLRSQIERLDYASY